MTVSKKDDVPILPYGFKHCPELARAATAQELKYAPRHRWFYFPHSYSHRLVNDILDFWDIPEGSMIADNFVGSGTTLLTARQRGLYATGFDLSPLAVTISNAKAADYEIEKLNQGLQTILGSTTDDVLQPSDRLSKAFTQQELREIFMLLQPIRGLSEEIRGFFLLALLWTSRNFSRAVPDGGWFRWQEWPDRSADIRQAFKRIVAHMLEDIDALNWIESNHPVQAQLADARNLPLLAESTDGLITSPPYANRHDYSRVFHIDLLLLGLSEAEVTELRHRSIRSHVEAKVPDACRNRLSEYSAPETLETVLGKMPLDADSRIMPLLVGYFEDIYLSLLEVERILKPGGRAAYVVGNVRHAGVMVPVDEIIAELAPQSGLEFDIAWVMRFRGNSAQQMGRYGREPARESVVLFSKV